MNNVESCNLCGNSEYRVLYPSGIAQKHQIVECSSCGLMYANPQGSVDVEQIVNYDPNWILENLDSPEIQQRVKKESRQVRDYEDTRKFINQHFPNTGKLLEIGSGYGYLCDFFQKSGWHVTGIEPNKALSIYAQKFLKLNSLPCELEEATFPNESFDIILMMHVIEHLSDPMTCMKLVREKLKPEGMFILETPRYDTLTYKLLKKRERSLSCDGHIFFFTSETLKKISVEAGFEVIKVDYVGRSLSLERILHNIGIISKSKIMASCLDKTSAALRLDKAWLTVNLRDMQRLYLRKP